MAAFGDIVELRLRIKDPLGSIAILSIASEDARLDLGSPSRQTAYLQLDTGTYHVFDADAEAWEPCDLLLSDARLGIFIDLYGAALAAPKAIKDITAELGQRLYVARTQDGAGSTDYQDLATMLAFYRGLAESMTEDVAKDAGTSTGRYLRMRRPCVGGGM